MTTATQTMVERYIEAELAVLDGKAVTMNGKTLTMVDLPAIREGRREWEARLERERGGGRPGFVRFI